MHVQPYEDLLREVLETGVHKGDRTGTGTRSVFGRQIRYDLSEGFPLLTSKRVPFNKVASELLWFVSGNSNVKPLIEQDNHIWTEWPLVRYLAATGQAVKPYSDEWADVLADYEHRILHEEGFAEQYGDLGPVYGVQWRSWPTPEGGEIDQLAEVIEEIKSNPNSRRLLVSAWNVSFTKEVALPPCHILFQFYVAEGKLSLMLTQRSSDMFLGVPFNIASYSLLLHMVAQQTDLEVGEFIWSSGDTHIYDNHVNQVKEQLSREPIPLPQLEIVRKPDSIEGYTVDDFVITGYQPHPTIRGAVAV